MFKGSKVKDLNNIFSPFSFFRFSLSSPYHISRFFFHPNAQCLMPIALSFTFERLNISTFQLFVVSFFLFLLPYYFTNSIIADSASSPCLKPALTILVYPPCLSLYRGAMSSNNFFTISLSFITFNTLLFA